MTRQGDREKMDTEKAKVGYYQLLLLALLAVNYVIVSMSHALPAFYNYTPKFHCQTENSANETYACRSFNVSASESNSSSLHETSSCSGQWKFAIEPGENSVVTEWNLVCERKFYTYLGSVLYYVGALMGAAIAGVLVDRIGRLPVQAICLYTQATMAVALYVIQSYPTFLALRGLQGVFVQGLQNSTYILSLELFPAKWRTFVALIMQVGWASGLVLLTALSYAIPDWRILQLAISVPSAITVLYIWIIPESPRWLMAKNKSTEADIAFERIAKYNNCCSKIARPNSRQIKVEASAMENNLTPVKPERKSRVSSCDLKKLKTADGTQDEATNLLNKSDLTLRKAQPNGSNEERSNDKRENGREIETAPSCSKTERKSKRISQLSGNNEQRASLKITDDIVVLRNPKNYEITNERESKINNRDVESKSIREIKDKTTMKELFKRPLTRRNNLVMFLQWYSSSMACYLFASFLPSFNVDRHVTFALGGVLEVATYTFAYFVLSRYGRRIPMGIYQLMNAFTCIALILLVALAEPSSALNDLTRTILLLFGKVSTISTVAVVYLYTVELSPTVVRGTCLGLCTIFAQLGTLSMPDIFLSGEYVSIGVPLSIVTTLSIASAIFVIILPETLNKILPDVVNDVEELIAKKRHEEIDEELNNHRNSAKEDPTKQDVLREKLFSEDWVDAGNGILVNFSDNKNAD